MNPGRRLYHTRLFSLAFRRGNAPLVCVLPALPISRQNWTVLVGASRLEMNRLGRSMPVGWRLLVSLISPHWPPTHREACLEEGDALSNYHSTGEDLSWFSSWFQTRGWLLIFLWKYPVRIQPPDCNFADRASWFKRCRFWLALGRYPVRIPAGTQSMWTEIFRGFPQSNELNAEILFWSRPRPLSSTFQSFDAIDFSFWHVLK